MQTKVLKHFVKQSVLSTAWTWKENQRFCPCHCLLFVTGQSVCMKWKWLQNNCTMQCFTCPKEMQASYAENLKSHLKDCKWASFCPFVWCLCRIAAIFYCTGHSKNSQWKNMLKKLCSGTCHWNSKMIVTVMPIGNIKRTANVTPISRKWPFDSTTNDQRKHCHGSVQCTFCPEL